MVCSIRKKLNVRVGRAAEEIFATCDHKGGCQADHGLTRQPYRRVRRLHTQGVVQGSRAIWRLHWRSRSS